MKAKLLYIFILGLLFFPRYTVASETGQVSCHFLQNEAQRQANVAGDIKNSNAFTFAHVADDNISADIDVEEEEDLSPSARKKISFEILCFFTNPPTFLKFHPISANKLNKFRSASIYHLSDSHFISLRVFRV